MLSKYLVLKLSAVLWLLSMTGPAGNPFNYSDAGPGGEMHPAMFWFANRLNDSALLWSEKYLMANKKPSSDRLLPAVMIWSAGNPSPLEVLER